MKKKQGNVTLDFLSSFWKKMLKFNKRKKNENHRKEQKVMEKNQNNLYIYTIIIEFTTVKVSYIKLKYD